MNNSEHPASVIKQKQVDIIRDSAGKAERDGKFTKAQIGLINEQGWFKMLVPSSYGGLQLALPDTLQLLESLANSDGSLGWMVTRCALAGWAGGFLGQEVAGDILSNEKICVAGSMEATGTAESKKDGYTLNGKWSSVTGTADATAFIVNCTVLESETLQVTSFLLLKDEVAITTNWNGLGLAATGSNDIEVNNLIVPESRAFKMTDSAAIVNSRLYHFPQLQLTEATMAVNIAGMASHFIDLCKTMLEGMKSSNGTPLMDDNLVQDTMEKYTQKMNDARVKLYYAAELSWQACVNQQPIKDTILYKVSAAAQDLTRKCRECVDALMPFCGMAAMDKSAEINRVWRDLHTASQESLLVLGAL